MNKLLISHRGNLRGPNPDYENNPEHIVKNVLPNFDCEVDLRFDSHNNTFYLGHDFNQYEIDFSWLENFSKKLWIHCKDFDSLDYLCRSSSELNYFWHENDSFTITSKSKLAQLVEKKIVSGWDDPRMPTISGLRKRGYTPQSLKNFAVTVGVSKRENVIDASLLEFCVRSHLNEIAPRAMAVINPLKIKIINYAKQEGEKINFDINPQNKEEGKREIIFTDEMFIEKEDFQENPEEGFFRLSPGEEVRLKNAYIIKAVDVVKDEKGDVAEVLCEYDPKSKSGSNTPESNRRVKGTIHWVSSKKAVRAKINIYDRLFKVEEPGKNETIENEINENSLITKEAFVEPYLSNAKDGQQYQFQRLGYFVKTDNKKTLEFNKTVGLRDGWKK